MTARRDRLSSAVRRAVAPYIAAGRAKVPEPAAAEQRVALVDVYHALDFDMEVGWDLLGDILQVDPLLNSLVASFRVVVLMHRHELKLLEWASGQLQSESTVAVRSSHRQFLAQIELAIDLLLARPRRFRGRELPRVLDRTRHAVSGRCDGGGRQPPRSQLETWGILRNTWKPRLMLAEREVMVQAIERRRRRESRSPQRPDGGPALTTRGCDRGFVYKPTVKDGELLKEINDLPNAFNVLELSGMLPINRSDLNTRVKELVAIGYLVRKGERGPIYIGQRGREYLGV